MQNNVSIVSKEESLVVKYGMFDLGVEREGARTSLKYILSDMNDLRTRYIYLGFHLSEFEKFEYYKDFGYLTFYEFCDVNLGMDKSAVSRCVNVFEEFSFCDKNGVRHMQLDSKYYDYSYSQLCEMLSLSDDQRRAVTPGMTVKQIREMKKKVVATSQPAISVQTKLEDQLFDLIYKFLRKNDLLQDYSIWNDKIEWCGTDNKRYEIKFSVKK